MTLWLYKKLFIHKITSRICRAQLRTKYSMEIFRSVFQFWTLAVLYLCSLLLFGTELNFIAIKIGNIFCDNIIRSIYRATNNNKFGSISNRRKDKSKSQESKLTPVAIGSPKRKPRAQTIPMMIVLNFLQFGFQSRIPVKIVSTIANWESRPEIFFFNEVLETILNHTCSVVW